MRNHLKRFSKNYIDNFRGLPLIAWQNILLGLLESLCVGAFYFFSTYFVKDLHFTIIEAGLLISFYGLGAIVGGYLGGRLAEKFIPRLIAAGALLLQGVGYFLLSKVSSFDVLGLDAFILGIAGYGFITANYLSVLDNCQTQEQRLKALNWLSVVSNLGLGVSALLIGLYIDNLKYIFMFFGIVLFLLSGLIFRDHLSQPKEQQTSIECTISSDNQQSAFFNLFIFSSVFFVGMIISQISSTYSLYIQSIFPMLGIQAFSILFSINTLIIIFFEVQIGTVFKSCNKILMVGIGSFLIGLGMLMLSFKINFAVAIFACVIYTIGEILFFCMAQLICYQKQKQNSRGRGLGTFRSIYASSRAVGPSLGCYIYYQLSPQFLWYVCGAIGVTCLIGCNHFKKLYVGDST